MHKSIEVANNFFILSKLLNSLYGQFFTYFILLTERNYTDLSLRI